MHQPSSNGPVSDQLNRLEGDSAQTGGCHALTERLHRLEAEFADRDVFIGSLRKRQAKLAARADLLAGELSRLQQLHTLVVNSRSWKLTKPLRFVARLLRGEWGPCEQRLPVVCGASRYSSRWVECNICRAWSTKSTH